MSVQSRGYRPAVPVADLAQTSTSSPRSSPALWDRPSPGLRAPFAEPAGDGVLEPRPGVFGDSMNEANGARVRVAAARKEIHRNDNRQSFAVGGGKADFGELEPWTKGYENTSVYGESADAPMNNMNSMPGVGHFDEKIALLLDRTPPTRTQHTFGAGTGADEQQRENERAARRREFRLLIGALEDSGFRRRCRSPQRRVRRRDR